ncbi:MAG: polysaccharide deacetylase family protein [Burkholderiaceae bacterium]
MNTKMKSIVKRVVSPIVDATGLYDRRISHLVDEPGRLLVVMFHRVIDESDAGSTQDPFSLGMCVRRRHFLLQLKYLKSRFNVVPLAEALRSRGSGQSLPKATAAITFDDGYLDCLTYAAPVLKELGLPATFFVPTGGLAEGEAFWWDRAVAAVSDTRLSSVDLSALGLPGSVSLTPLNRRASMIRILDALWSQPAAALPDMLDKLIEALVPEQSYRLATEARAPRMSIEQVQEIATMGFTIGAHTVSHVDLRHLDADSVQHELVASRQMLETILDQPITTFAYPSGFHNEGLQRTVRAAGFESAVSTDRGINGADLNLHAVYRIGMPDTGVADFKRALSGAPVAGETLFDGSDAPVLTSLVR